MTEQPTGIGSVYQNTILGLLGCNSNIVGCKVGDSCVGKVHIYMLGWADGPNGLRAKCDRC